LAQVRDHFSSNFLSFLITRGPLFRAKVLDFLTKNHKNVVVDYLEHITTVWNETGSVFHNSLILQYKDIIVDLLNQDDLVSRDLSDKLDNTILKLRNLLSTSNSYTAESVIQQFPTYCLHSVRNLLNVFEPLTGLLNQDFYLQERAMLLGSMKKHTEALAINLYLVGLNLLHLILKRTAKCFEATIISDLLVSYSLHWFS